MAWRAAATGRRRTARMQPHAQRRDGARVELVGDAERRGMHGVGVRVACSGACSVALLLRLLV